MIIKSDSDEGLVKKTLNGSQTAFAELVRRYKDKVFSIGKRFFYNTHDAEDFVQEVFFKVYEKLETFRFRSKFKYWLGTIAYNHGINRKKSLHDIQSLDELALSEDKALPEEHLEKSELASLLVGAVNSLPEKYRICVELYFYWGLKYREISVIINSPVNTVKSNVLRAKMLLRDMLKGTGVEDFE